MAGFTVRVGSAVIGDALISASYFPSAVIAYAHLAFTAIVVGDAIVVEATHSRILFFVWIPGNVVFAASDPLLRIQAVCVARAPCAIADLGYLFLGGLVDQNQRGAKLPRPF